MRSSVNVKAYRHGWIGHAFFTIFISLSIVFAAGLSITVAAAQTATFITGVDTHFGQHNNNAAEGFALARQAGIRSIRDEVSWGKIEKERGQLVMPPALNQYVDAAVQAGITPLLILDYGNSLYDDGNKPRSAEAIAAFTRYATFVAQHFRGKVRFYEVWNEWDNGGGGTIPGTVDDYVPLLKSVYAAIKRVDPNITVLSDAVVLGDFQKMAQLNVLRYADGISVHPYFFNHGPNKTPEAWANWMNATEASLSQANGGAAVPLYVTEIGWPTHWGTDGVSLVRSAAYAARLLLLARTMPFLKGLWWYDFINDGQDPHSTYNNYGLVWNDLTPKPGFYLVGDVTHSLANAALFERKKLADDDDWLLRFRLPNDREIWALWTAKRDAFARFKLTATGNPAKLEAHEAGGRSFEPEWIPDTGGQGKWRLSLTAGETPLLIEGALAGIAVDKVEHPEYPAELR